VRVLLRDQELGVLALGVLFLAVAGCWRHHQLAKCWET